MLYIACAVLWLLRFALGASIFSFLGVVIWRLPRGESVVKGRSHCPACGRTLSAAELVPCLSFLVQGGADVRRARHFNGRGVHGHRHARDL